MIRNFRILLPNSELNSASLFCGTEKKIWNKCCLKSCLMPLQQRICRIFLLKYCLISILHPNSIDSLLRGFVHISSALSDFLSSTGCKDDSYDWFPTSKLSYLSVPPTSNLSTLTETRHRRRKTESYYENCCRPPIKRHLFKQKIIHQIFLWEISSPLCQKKRKILDKKHICTGQRTQLRIRNWSEVKMDEKVGGWQEQKEKKLNDDKKVIPTWYPSTYVSDCR